MTPAFLFAVLLWEPVRLRSLVLQSEDWPPHPALHQAADEVLERQLTRVSLPRRFSTPMREIWALQARFDQTKGKRPARLLSHPRFRAAYDFLLLRAAAGEVDQALADWWTDYQAGRSVPSDRHADDQEQSRSRGSRRGPRRRRKSHPGKSHPE